MPDKYLEKLIRDQLATRFEDNANWRDRQARKYPEDEDKNQTCALHLRRLARDVREEKVGQEPVQSLARLVHESGLTLNQLMTNGRDNHGQEFDKPNSGSPNRIVSQFGWPYSDGLYGVSDPERYLSAVAQSILHDYGERLRHTAGVDYDSPDYPRVKTEAEIPAVAAEIKRLADAQVRTAVAVERVVELLEALPKLSFTISGG